MKEAISVFLLGLMSWSVLGMDQDYPPKMYGPLITITSQCFSVLAFSLVIHTVTAVRNNGARSAYLGTLDTCR